MSSGWIEIYETVKHLPLGQRESAFKEAWLLEHKDASSMVFDTETGQPHQAIYAYPLSPLAQREELKEFFAAVEAVRGAAEQEKK